MKYRYGVTDNQKGGKIINAPKLISLLQKEVKQGKWNIYQGGDTHHNAKISYQGKNWEYGEHIYITGSPRELEYLEQQIKKFIKVIPRKF